MCWLLPSLWVFSQCVDLGLVAAETNAPLVSLWRRYHECQTRLHVTEKETYKKDLVPDLMLYTWFLSYHHKCGTWALTRSCRERSCSDSWSFLWGALVLNEQINSCVSWGETHVERWSNNKAFISMYMSTILCILTWTVWRRCLTFSVLSSRLVRKPFTMAVRRHSALCCSAVTTYVQQGPVYKPWGSNKILLFFS